MSDDGIRRQLRTSTTRYWGWDERWGPQIGDVTNWSVVATGTQVHVRRNDVEVTMSADVAAKVLKSITEALEVQQ